MVEYTNSNLVSYTKLSPNHSGKRSHAIDRITPHCVVGQASVETLGKIFAPVEKQASCNYGIGVDGRVGMYVEEKNRSWCSSSRENDQRAVTIECASSNKHPYEFKDVVYQSLVKLCADICKRNGKTTLRWIPNKAAALGYTPLPTEMLLTVHRWFTNKSCPGDWMYSRMGDLANKVTHLLNEKPFKCWIQIATYKYKGSAEKVTAKLNSDGFKARIKESGSIYEVMIDELNSLEDCESIANRLKIAGFKPFIVYEDLHTTDPQPPLNAIVDHSKAIWEFLKTKGLNDFAVAGIMGNLFAESSLRPNNLQQAYEAKLQMSDEEYTKAVDEGRYDNFVHDKAGYGLAQWTHWSRKQALKDYVDGAEASIGDLNVQLSFLWNELQGYKYVMSVLKDATSIREASDAVCIYYEVPANKNEEETLLKRASFGKKYYDLYSLDVKISPPNEFTPYRVKVQVAILNVRKNPSKSADVATQIKDRGVYTIVDQTDDGVWGKLKSGAGWIMLDFANKI